MPLTSLELMGKLTVEKVNNSISTKDDAYQYTIDTLTQIEKDILTKAKYYTIRPSDFMPVRVGYGSFNRQLIRNVVADVSDSFFAGDINTGESSALSGVSTFVRQKALQVKNWAKYVQYNIFDVYQALQASQLDLIEQFLEARYRNWQLGIQEVAFLGHPTDSNVRGLLTSGDPVIDTSTIPKSIVAMSDSETATFVGALLGAYLVNTNNTAMPNRFVIPATVHAGLATPMSSAFPNISKLKYLEDNFKMILAGHGINDFKILPCYYADKANLNLRTGVGGANKYRYVLYREDKETLTMNIPVDLTTTQFNSLDNFQFQNVGYGQYTGVGVYRPLEVMYFDHS